MLKKLEKEKLSIVSIGNRYGWTNNNFRGLVLEYK